MTGLPKIINGLFEETEEASARAYFADRRGSTLCIGENSTGASLPMLQTAGIVLKAAVQLLRGLEELIEDRTGINTMTADDPMTCVAIGFRKICRIFI